MYLVNLVTGSPLAPNPLAPNEPFDAAARDLIRIAEIFRSVNKLVLFQMRVTRTYWEDNGKPNMDPFIGLSLEELNTQTTAYLESHLVDQTTGRRIHLQRTLLDFSYQPYWSAMINALFRNLTSDWAVRNLAKQSALSMLEERDRAAKLFVSVIDEVESCGQEWIDVCESIRNKIRVLDKFKAVYDAVPPMEKPDPVLHTVYPLKSLDSLKSQIRSGAGTQEQEQVCNLEMPFLLLLTRPPQPDSTTPTAFVFLSTLLAMVPLAFAYLHSTRDIGSTSDSDFFVSIQSSIMTAASIAISVYPTFRWQKSASTRWSQVSGALGLICAVVAIPLYVKVPKIWSAFANFAAMVVQVFMALQLAIGGGGMGKKLKGG